MPIVNGNSVGLPFTNLSVVSHPFRLEMKNHGERNLQSSEFQKLQTNTIPRLHPPPIHRNMTDTFPLESYTILTGNVWDANEHPPNQCLHMFPLDVYEQSLDNTANSRNNLVKECLRTANAEKEPTLEVINDYTRNISYNNLSEIPDCDIPYTCEESIGEDELDCLQKSSERVHTDTNQTNISRYSLGVKNHFLKKYSLEIKQNKKNQLDNETKENSKKNNASLKHECFIVRASLLFGSNQNVVPTIKEIKIEETAMTNINTSLLVQKINEKLQVLSKTGIQTEVEKYADKQNVSITENYCVSDEIPGSMEMDLGRTEVLESSASSSELELPNDNNLCSVEVKDDNLTKNESQYLNNETLNDIKKEVEENGQNNETKINSNLLNSFQGCDDINRKMDILEVNTQLQVLSTGVKKNKSCIKTNICDTIDKTILLKDKENTNGFYKVNSSPEINGPGVQSSNEKYRIEIINKENDIKNNTEKCNEKMRIDICMHEKKENIKIDEVKITTKTIEENKSFDQNNKESNEDNQGRVTCKKKHTNVSFKDKTIIFDENNLNNIVVQSEKKHYHSLLENKTSIENQLIKESHCGVTEETTRINLFHKSMCKKITKKLKNKSLEASHLCTFPKCKFSRNENNPYEKDNISHRDRGYYYCTNCRMRFRKIWKLNQHALSCHEGKIRLEEKYDYTTEKNSLTSLLNKTDTLYEDCRITKKLDLVKEGRLTKTKRLKETKEENSKTLIENQALSKSIISNYAITPLQRLQLVSYKDLTNKEKTKINLTKNQPEKDSQSNISNNVEYKYQKYFLNLNQRKQIDALKCSVLDDEDDSDDDIKFTAKRRKVLVIEDEDENISNNKKKFKEKTCLNANYTKNYSKDDCFEDKIDDYELFEIIEDEEWDNMELDNLYVKMFKPNI